MAGPTLPMSLIRVLLEGTVEDHAGLLAAAGVSPLLLADDRSRVTYGQAAAVIEALWAATEDEMLGLGPRPVPQGTSRLLGLALLSSPDLRTVARRMLHFRRAVGAVAALRADIGPETTRISVDHHHFDGPHHLLCEALLALAHRFMSWMIGRRIALRSVELPYPRAESLLDHELAFGAPVWFGADRAAIVVDSAVLDLPVMQDEASFDAMLEHAAAELLTRRDWGATTADQVRKLLEQGLQGPWPDPETVAARLRMSEPTMRRRLKELGTSFSAIKEDVLRDAAITSLAQGQESVTALAERLGFSEPSAFRRAFRRWTGSSPGQYQHSAGGG